MVQVAAETWCPGFDRGLLLGFAQAIAELADKTWRDRYELLDEAVDDLIDKYRRKSSPPQR